MNVIFYWENIPICGLITEKALNSNKLLLLTKKLEHTELFEKYIPNLKNIKVISTFENFNSEQEFLFIASGWSNKEQLSLVNDLNSRGIKVVLAADNSSKGNFRQLVGMIYFRFFLKSKFKLAWVPGNSGFKLMRLLGFRKGEIFKNLYGASSLVFNSKYPIYSRRKEFLFVGQLIHRKGLKELVKGYERYIQSGGEWGLRVVGSGALEEFILSHKEIHFEGHQDPVKISKLMNQSVCLVVPSKLDHWATVVCEAAACGMILLVSKNVGASEDLVEDNGYVMKNIHSKTIANFMHKISRKNSLELESMSKNSVELAKRFDQNKFYEIIENFSKID
jgi:glycosyltransferase involved in cell wall biosynthesis